jgi:hypothetical protein
LLQSDSISEFVAALQWIDELPSKEPDRLRKNARATADRYSLKNCSEHALGCYQRLSEKMIEHSPSAEYEWERLRGLLKTEWEILKGIAESAGAAFSSEGTSEYICHARTPTRFALRPSRSGRSARCHTFQNAR